MALATFLLGEVNTGAVQISDRITTRAEYYAFYAQDDWRFTERLTLNYGLRYDLELPRREVDNRMNSFDVDEDQSGLRHTWRRDVRRRRRHA